MIQITINNETWDCFLLNSQDKQGDWKPYKLSFKPKPIYGGTRYPVFLGTSRSNLYVSWFSDPVCSQDDEMKKIAEQVKNITSL